MNNKAGISNDGSAANSVRFWAGSDYEGRTSAPFRVTQNGDVFASNGEFTGLLRGTLDSGDVQIYNNRLTIHIPETETEIIHLDASSAIFNTAVVIGNDKVVYDPSSDTLYNNSRYSQTSEKGSIVSNEFLYDDMGAYEEYVLMGTECTVEGGSHRIKYHRGFSGLIFDSTGNLVTPPTSNEDPYDFKFERLDGDSIVKVQGSIALTNSMSSPSHNIEMRSIVNEGWGFYAM